MHRIQRLETRTVCHSDVIREEPTRLTYRKYRLATNMPSWTYHPRHRLWAASVVLLVSIVSTALINSSAAVPPVMAQATSVFQATLLEPNQKTGEVSTDELRQVIQDGSAVVFDSRPPMEYAVSHIPGALNVAPKPGVPMSQYVSDVSEIGRSVADPSTPIVLYCNGPFCGKSKRLGEDLLDAGYTSVRRYQLGAPTWRALVGVMQIELDGIRYVREGDRTAVFVDARPAEDFRTGTLPGSRDIPIGEVIAAKDDGRLPMEDHNTRIVVFGANAEQARADATELAKNAFHNVTFFDGTLAELIVGLGAPTASGAEERGTAASAAYAGPRTDGRVEVLMAEVDTQEYILSAAGGALRQDALFDR